MNKALLLIVADFLLISMLALARFDIPEDEAAQEPPEQIAEREEQAQDEDLIDVLQLSLQQEEDRREALNEALQAEAEKARQLAEEKGGLEEEKSSLLETQKHLEVEKLDLANTFELAQKELDASKQDASNLMENLISVRETAAAEKERVRFLQEQLQSKDVELEEASVKIDAVEKERQAVEGKVRELTTVVQIKDTEKRILEENLSAARTEIEIVRVEKEQIHRQTTKLAEGVSVLAQSSTAIQEEIRQIQPLSLNVIFNSFKENRVVARFDAELGGGRKRQFQAKTIFLTDGIKTYAVFHTRDTPFRLTGQSPNLQNVRGTLFVGNSRIELSEAGFLAADPRVLAVPVDATLLESEGIKVFPLALEPLRFPEAVLINSDEGYYGETGFKLDPQQEGYFRMQNKVFSRIFGEFSPSRSDLVFAQSGDFLGLMVNNQFCILVDSFYFAGRIPLGDDFSTEEADKASAVARGLLARRPSELQ